MHYYQHHIGDFIKATARLSDGQAMAYLRLLWNYYDKDGVIEHDIDQIAFEIGSDAKTVDLIIKTYFKVEGGFIKQSRCDKEIEGYLKKSTGGKQGANKRWSNKDSNSLPNGIAIANSMPTQCDPNANQEPITNNQQPVLKADVASNKATSTKPASLQEFETFWKAYPRGEKKVAALDAWKKIKPSPELQAEFLRSLEAQKQSQQWIEGIIPHASTWLNGKRWLDELKPQIKPVDSAYQRKIKTLSGLTGGILGNSSDGQFKPISEPQTIDMDSQNENLLR